MTSYLRFYLSRENFLRFSTAKAKDLDPLLGLDSAFSNRIVPYRSPLVRSVTETVEIFYLSRISHLESDE